MIGSCYVLCTVSFSFHKSQEEGAIIGYSYQKREPGYKELKYSVQAHIVFKPRHPAEARCLSLPYGSGGLDSRKRILSLSHDTFPSFSCLMFCLRSLLCKSCSFCKAQLSTSKLSSCSLPIPGHELPLLLIITFTLSLNTPQYFS